MRNEFLTMDKESTFLFLGDVVPYKKFRFRNSSRIILNLECPITTIGRPISGKINLSVKENYLRQIFGQKLIAVCLANNHILDFGLDGLNSTLRELEREDIKCFGLNKPENDDLNPLVMEFGTMKVAFLAAICETTNPLVEFDDFYYLSLLDMKDLSYRIEKVRKSVDRVVVYIHWGEEESSYPLGKDIMKARQIIDMGADIIIGSHAHAAQAVERYRNGIIAYSLGNFIMPAFDEIPSYFNEEGVPQSAFSKRLMLWNRFSWGLEADLKSMEFRVRKFAFLADRILEFNSTPFDRYLDLDPVSTSDHYDKLIRRHLERRTLKRRIKDFIYKPHIPGRILKNK